MIVFDIVVNGEIKETVQPTTSRLKEIVLFMKDQAGMMKRKYGKNVTIERRMLY